VVAGSQTLLGFDAIVRTRHEPRDLGLRVHRDHLIEVA
jgi:hypothetical protein